jgi:pheromone shutdown protein TraB
MTKIYFLGITHIDHESQQRVTQFLEEQKPDAVCLELDSYRLESLLAQEELLNEPDENPKKVEFNSAPINENSAPISIQHKEEESEDYSTINSSEIFSSMSSILEDIGFFENELAHLTQTKLPSREMILAYKIAKKLGSEVFLIDRSIFDISRIMEEEVSEEEGQNFRKMVDDLILGEKITIKNHSLDSNDNESKMAENSKELDLENQLTE